MESSLNLYIIVVLHSVILKLVGKNRKSNKASLKSTANRQQELLHCKVCDARFPCWSQLESHYFDTKHRVSIVKKSRSTKFQPPHQKEPPLADSFSEKVRRRIVKEGAQNVVSNNFCLC